MKQSEHVIQSRSYICIGAESVCLLSYLSLEFSLPVQLNLHANPDSLICETALMSSLCSKVYFIYSHNSNVF